MVATVVPPAERLPDVLPCGDLNADGRPTGALRRDLRSIDNLRNALTVVFALGQSVGVVALALALHHPVAWVAAFFLAGRGFALLAILAHEAAHRLLFTNRRANDFVGAYLIGAPAFVPVELYRRGHMAHHREEFGPNEPDLALYSGYPIARDSLRRKLTRDAVGISGWKNLKPLLMALTKKESRPIATRIVAAQLVLFAGFALAGYPLAWPLLWLAPWMTVWRVINRLRSIAEHGGMQKSADRRQTTHHVRQSRLASFWMVPYNTGYHLAHHVDIGVPWRKLPAFHAELARAGYVNDALTYPNYRALWRALIRESDA